LVNNQPRSFIARLYGGTPPEFAPAITKQPQASSPYREGMDVVLFSAALAYPAPTFQWQFNGVPLPGATSPGFVLNNVRATNAGSYQVIISNPLGSVTSRVATVSIIPARTNAGAVDIDFYSGFGPDDYVSVVRPLAAGKSLIAGSFSSVDGISQPYLARLDISGQIDPSFTTALNDIVNVVEVLPNRKILIGGAFSFVNGAPKYGIARLMENGALDPVFNVPFDSSTYVTALAAATNGQVILAGYLSPMNGLYYGSIIRVTSIGEHDHTFNAGSGADGWVSTMAVDAAGRVLVGGVFATFNGKRHNCLVRLNSDGSIDSTFNTGSGASGEIRALAIQPDGKILIVGRFRSFNGVSRHQIARLNTDGSVDLSFDPGVGPDAAVYTVSLQRDAKILIGGTFLAVNNHSEPRFARLHTDGSLDFTFNPGEGASYSVQSIVEAEPGRILIGGDFTYVDGLPRPFVARVISQDPPPSAPVIVQNPTTQMVRAGSDVTLSVEAAGVPPPSYQWQLNGMNIPGATQWILHLRNVGSQSEGSYSVVTYNSNGSLPSLAATILVDAPARFAGSPDISFFSGSGPNDRVKSVAVDTNDNIIIGGDFTQVSGFPLRRIARLTANGTVDNTFSTGAGADNTVSAVTLQPDGRILIAGAFNSINNVPRSHVARLARNGEPDSTFAPPVVNGGDVYALCLQPGGQILIGGTFTNVGGVIRYGMARLQANGALDATFVPALGSNVIVRAIAVMPDGKILVGGNFSVFAGTFRSYFTRLNSDGSLDTTFAIAGAGGDVFAISLDSATNAVLGGAFRSVNGVLRSAVARITAAGVLDTNFFNTNDFAGTAYAVLSDRGSNVVAGGNFNWVGSRYVGREARLLPNGAFDTAFIPGEGMEEGSSSIDEYGNIIDLTSVMSLAAQRDGKIIAAGDFTTVNGMARPYVARLFPQAAMDKLAIRLAGPNTELKWDTGLLQSADSVAGPWTTITNASTPTILLEHTNVQKFYRLRFN
jgi:uncharacterized delta-60 repeat protein